MESAGKQQGSSDTSSEESDHRVTTKRSYECTFCKRGFTNAQALGGHMNIHRKDRAKAKQRPTSSAAPNRPVIDEEYYMNPRYVPTIPIHDPSKYYPILEAQTQRNYHMFFQQPGTNPRVLPYGHYDCDFLAPASTMSQSLSFDEEISGANLSLRIGPANVDEDEMIMRKGINKEDEVDLELRLGHDP